ncbi:MAG: cytochrome P450 [Terriglobia bacterium]
MKSSVKLPPGPPGRFLVGTFPMGGQDPLTLLTDWARLYGDIFHYRAFSAHVYFLNHPEAIESVLVKHPQDFVKGRGLQVNRRLFGDGLLTNEGDAWLAQRRLCQPPFRRERMEEYGALMAQYASRMIEGWQDGEVRNLQADMARLTLQIVTRALFGIEIGSMAPKVAGALKPVMDFNTRGRILLPALRYLPTPVNVRYRLAARRLERVVDEIIQQRRASRQDGDDLLSLLLRARDENPDGMPRSLLRDQVMTLLLAGHETTALTLCWTFYLIALHPLVEHRLEAEIRDVLGDRPPGALDIPSVPYAERIVKESLRLYPPAYAMVRVALRDIEIGGYVVPQGASVIMSQWIVHRDPRFYADPASFDPDRWTAGFASQLPRFAYFPFGGGPRACIGAFFALTEATLLLVTILQKFHIQLASKERLIPVPAITLRPQTELRAVVTRR